MRDGQEAAFELVLAEGTRVALAEEVVIGRAPGSTVRLADPSVSRVHARVVPSADGPLLEDAGSSHGTWLDGVRVTAPVTLRDGARIRVGDAELAVSRRRDPAGAGATLVVPEGASLALGAATTARPRLRSGYALKRLDASEGEARWVLRDLRAGTFLRLRDAEASLLDLLDGGRTVAELVVAAQDRLGAGGPARLARLLADLGERGLLAGVAGTGGDPAPPSRLRRLIGPRELTLGWVGRLVAVLHRSGGRLLFTRPALLLCAAVAVAGVVAFGALVADRYGTPFVVASKLGLGGVVFLLGRFAVVAVHELAHALAMAQLGRPVRRAGLKAVAIFPYAFVDTSEAWLEPRRRRIAVSAAGPAADLVVGGAFALACLLLGAGAVRDVCFQVAFAAYVGAFFNANPFLDRDGYHVLVDVWNEPGLRARARAQLERRLAGRGGGPEPASPVLLRYALAGLAWSVLAAAFAVVLSLRYAPVLSDLAPGWVVWVVLGTLWVALFVPVALAVGRPLATRLTGRPA